MFCICFWCSYIVLVCMGWSWCLALLAGSVLVLGMVCVWFLFPILSRAHVGYLHLVRTFLRCCCSVLSSSGVRQTALALSVNVLMTLYVAAIWWWLCHCMYWSVCVGFLSILMGRVLFCSGVMMVSKKGMEPSGHVFCTLTLIIWSIELMCCMRFSLCFVLCLTKVSSTSFQQSGWVLWF